MTDARYQLDQRLGEGATASVWRARGPRGEVALKIGHEPAAATGLAAEALVGSLAVSPRLPELVDLGLLAIAGDEARVAARGQPFVALSLSPGRALSPGETLPLDRIIGLARHLAEALADLHDVGLAHGDVKPANITLAEDGSARLIDLGLAGPAYDTAVAGATPRYLARGDRALGDARARDLLALGLCVAELCDPAIAASDAPLALARTRPLPAPLDRLCAALLAPDPGARPSAQWVCDRLAGALPRDHDADAARWIRRVRASYLRQRRRDISRASGCKGEVAPWLAGAVDLAGRARAMCAAAGVAPPEPLGDPALQLGPLDAEQRTRWLVALVGSAAERWRLNAPSEPELARALCSLAAARHPRAWTPRDVEAALADAPVGARDAPVADIRFDAATSAALGLRVARVPPDDAALAIVEGHADQAPVPLLLATADALRLRGELGRARALVHGIEGGGAIVADVLRRAGDLEQAAQIAEASLADDPDGRARGTLARMRVDAGDLAGAEALIGPLPEHAATAEVAAYCAVARGDVDVAVRHAERGLALAVSHEARARLSGALAYVHKVLRSDDPASAKRGFTTAVDHAIQAGAELEEASYLTGLAATCVDLGELEAAIDAARRASLLFEEVLGRPAQSARAWLARAAAYAAIDLTHEAVSAAEQALEQARASGDQRARAYALWCIADVHAPGEPRAAEAARHSAALIDDDAGDDAVLAAARLWRHCPDAIADHRRRDLDARCKHAAPRVGPFGRLAWWHARAERHLASADGRDAHEGRMLLFELVALADARAPIGTLGKAMHGAVALASALGDSDALARVDAARREAARTVMRHAVSFLAEPARACSWVVRRDDAAPPAIAAEQALDLRQLVRALSEREDVPALLDRVVDVLLLWTHAERGLLLLCQPDGSLAPSSARNLRRRDLSPEQLAVSQSLAQRALASGAPVVAIDAMQELSSSYDSVHALKLRSVLVIPLVTGGETLGVVYLDDRLRRGAFGDKELAWAQAVAPIAALAISDARVQQELRQARDVAEAASRKLEHALAIKETALDVAERELRHAVNATPSRFADIIGDSAPMRQLLRLVERVGKSDVPVLLRGESGSGKELIARAIHRCSGRAQRAFVGENCGALPETLLESTLFGHVKGAFTGAHRSRVGLFEAADGGTLFLDEIGEMSLGMQTKLLRILEDNLVRPVGATHTRRVDVRIVAATHRDLEAMVSDGTFRQDLYYRLNVITIPIPPLRERSEDIPQLVAHLIGKHAPGRAVRVSRSAMTRLIRASWPGNVRQLENEIRRALLLCDGSIETSHLSSHDDGESVEATLGLNVRARIDQLETTLVTQALERTQGNQTQAAKLLGVSRYGLHKMIKRLGIQPER